MWHRLSLALTKNWRFKTWGFAHKRFELSTWQGFAKSKIGNLCWELHQLQRLIHYFQHVGTCWTLDTFHTFQCNMMSKAKMLQLSNLRESRFSRILENFFPISLLDLDLEAFSFHFSLSISISRHFHFTFHSRNEWKEKQIHFSFLEKSESISDFTLFLEKKEWIMHVLS